MLLARESQGGERQIAADVSMLPLLRNGDRTKQRAVLQLERRATNGPAIVPRDERGPQVFREAIRREVAVSQQRQQAFGFIAAGVFDGDLHALPSGARLRG